MRDSRVKLCPNPLCAKHITKVKHRKPTEQFCTFCGRELVYACSHCLERIEDKGPNSRLCSACQAEMEEHKEKMRSTVKAGASAVSAAAASITGKIPLIGKQKNEPATPKTIEE